MPPLGHGVVDVNKPEGGAISVSDVENHGVEGRETVVGSELDVVGGTEGYPGVDGNLAGIGGCMFGQVGVPPVIVGEALLGLSHGVCIGADSGDCIKP